MEAMEKVVKFGLLAEKEREPPSKALPGVHSLRVGQYKLDQTAAGELIMSFNLSCVLGRSGENSETPIRRHSHLAEFSLIQASA